MRRTILVAACLTAVCAIKAQTVKYDYFTYRGDDARFKQEYSPSHQYLNPILAGFYPDPSMCRVGDTYYLVTSSFSFFPGVPLFTSKDLVNWERAGYVLDRPSQLPLKNQYVSGGIFAPGISYNKKNKTWYMITTNVGAGNFYVKTTDPAKGWSEPMYLPKIDGIDPSFFFDSDGKGYIVHNAPPVGKEDYEGQRAIRMLEFDVNGDSIPGTYKEILRGGTHVVKNPIWIEGPHIFKRGKYYYLMCAEGGTGYAHSEVILRSKSLNGKWEECPHNPILTQRDLPMQRQFPVSCAGHADIVEDGKGNWWAVFLGCRPYEEDYYNTGRDTYLLPVKWENDWPVILPKGEAIPVVNEKAGLKPKGENLFTGNFSYSDDFSGSQLHPRWMTLRDGSKFYTTGKGISFEPMQTNIYSRDNLSAIWTRQQHTCFTAETQMEFMPKDDKQLAGFALLQNENYNFTFGKTMRQGKPVVELVRMEKQPVIVASAPVKEGPLKLKIAGNGRYYDFYYSDGGDYKLLVQGVDAVILSTGKSDGFIGACIGLYATKNKNKQ